MSLLEIKNELYKKEPDKEKLEHDKSEFNIESVTFSPAEKKETVADDWLEKTETLEGNDRKLVKKGLFILGGLLLVIALVFGFFKIRQVFFSPERTILSLEGPMEIKSGNLVAYEIRYRNDNRADLENVTLRMSYPEDFKPEGNAD